MVRDSNFNGWIYVVKSGSVQVLKKLVHTEPSVHRKTGEILSHSTDADFYLAFKTGRPTLDRLLAACGVDFPQPLGDRIKQQNRVNSAQHHDVTDETLTLLTDCSFGANSPRLRRSHSAMIRTRGQGRHVSSSSYKHTRSHTLVEFSGTPTSRRDYPLSLQKSKYIHHDVIHYMYMRKRS